MSDAQRAAAENSIATTRRNVAASLRALEPLASKPAASSSSTAIVPVPAAGLSDITLQLLTTLRGSVTTLALAFKPPITPDGIRAYLDKTADQMGRLVSCVLAAAGGDGSSTSSDGAPGFSALVEMWRDGVQLIGDEVLRLLTVLEEGVRSGDAEAAETSAGASKGESPYLAHTGMVWEAIDKVKATLPPDERAAVQQRWELQKDTVRDAWDEFKEMLEGDDDDDDDDDDDMFGGGDDEDDEWAELEKAMGGSLSASEKKRAEAAKPLFGLHQILHATLPRYLPLLHLQPQEQTYAPLLTAGSDLVAALDTAVSAMYPKQDVAEILGAVDALNVQGRGLADVFRARLALAGGDADKVAMAKSFADRWEARLEQEVKTWEEGKMSMSALEAALE